VNDCINRSNDCINGRTEAALAYLAEYGRDPQGREEWDRFNAFRFGYEAGKREGSDWAWNEVYRIAGKVLGK
jgi:hypothetical protein